MCTAAVGNLTQNIVGEQNLTDDYIRMEPLFTWFNNNPGMDK